MAVVIFALLCWLNWLLVNRYLNKALRNLIEGMDQLAEKNFTHQLEGGWGGEFKSLASSFNDMSAMLSSSLTELKKSQDYLRSILESSADIIITVNPAGKIQTINAGAERALGYARFDVIGKPIEILFADPKERYVAIDKLKHADDVVNYQIQLLTASRDVRDVLLTISRLRNSENAIIGTIGIGKDITEEKRLQHELIQSQRLATIGEVFTGIQHSMKNLLNACKGGAYMVKIGLTTDNRKMLEEGWAMVEEGITRLTGMSQDMLKYVKDWRPRPDRVDINNTLADIHKVIKQTAKDKGVEFRFEPNPGLPIVKCDGRMMHSAIMDIVSNALDACLWKDYDNCETPEVTMAAHTEDDDRLLVIEVKDNGCGMSEDVKENIFTPFFSTKSKAGTGLGLSITTRMISVHDGTIEVESQPDKGSVFRIVLPVNGTDKNKERNDG
jgi:PAS domain S-box-containing protein